MAKSFRPCAGAIVFNSEGLLLLGNRIETKEDAWQFPQGGIEAGESPAFAARRELYEETSLKNVSFVFCEDKPTRYEFSDEIKENFKKRGIVSDGQEIYFSLFYFCGDETEIDVNTMVPEFKQYAWKSFDFAVENIIDFKKEVYAAAEKKFMPLIRQYLDKLS